MSDERTLNFGERDFGGREQVREVEVEEFGEGEQINEVGEELELGVDEEFKADDEDKEGEKFVSENEIGEGEEGFPVKNDVSSRSKRIKEMEIDRLSALPDCLLIHILTFLNPKRAMITSVLSKRWQYLWTDLPSLSFDEGSEHEEKVRKFVTLIHRTLGLRRVNCLETFGVDFTYDECFATDVDAWVEFAVRNKVKQFILRLNSYEDLYALPQRMYSSSSLTWLRLLGCSVAPQRTINWKSLTKLEIIVKELHQHVIEKILAGCPVLYSLDIRTNWGFKCLEVNSPSLNVLGVSDFGGEKSNPSLEITAPYIRFLDILLYPIERKKLRLTNISSLVRACIDLSPFNCSSVEAMNNTKELFEKIQHVKELELGGPCSEVLSNMTINGWQLPQSTRLTSLIIKPWRDEHSMFGILGVLESSPNLETLVIESWHPYEESVRTWDPVVGVDLSCDLPHLKTIKFIDYADPNLGG